MTQSGDSDSKREPEQRCTSMTKNLVPAQQCVKDSGHVGPHVSERGVWWIGR